MPPKKDPPEPPKNPKLTILEPAGAAPSSGPVMDPGKPSTYTRATASPVAAAVAGTPSIPQWRVWIDRDGNQSYLGVLASHATPEALIAKFPASMPSPGRDALFILKGLTVTGKEVAGEPMHFRISGDNPDVMNARAGLTAPAAGHGSADGAFLLLETRLRQLEDERIGLQLARRQLEDEEKHRRQLEIDRIRTESEERIKTMQAEAKLRQDEQEARFRREQQEERNRRDEERKDRDAADERRRTADREFFARMETLNKRKTIPELITEATAVLAAVGVKPGELLDRVLSPPAAGAETWMGAAASFGSTLVTKIGDVVLAKIEADGGPKRERADVQRVEPQQRRIEGPTGNANPAPNPAPEAKKPDPAAGVPVAVARKARNALRALVAELPGVPEAERQARAMATVAAEPAIVQYCKAVGVKAALLEAGATEEWATQLEAHPAVKAALA